jgi:hypothetical protein
MVRVSAAREERHAAQRRIHFALELRAGPEMQHGAQRPAQHQEHHGALKKSGRHDRSIVARRDHPERTDQSG